VKTAKFVRKPFPVEAVQVTERNMEEVAAWCQGDIQFTNPRPAPAGDDGRRRFIKVRVLRPMGEKQTQAFAGDWVLYAGTGYKVYRDAAFHNSFDRVTQHDEGYVAKSDDVEFPAVDGLIAALSPDQAEVKVTPNVMAKPGQYFPPAPVHKTFMVETDEGVIEHRI
jgi:hypothetical protein